MRRSVAASDVVASVEVASVEACAVSAVQATRENLLPYYGTVGGRRVLVIGVIHGNEDAGVAIVDQLLRKDHQVTDFDQFVLQHRSENIGRQHARVVRLDAKQDRIYATIKCHTTTGCRMRRERKNRYIRAYA